MVHESMIFTNPRILSVSELTTSIRGLLETEFPFVAVTGEISNVRTPYSGHIYFTLKDEEAQLKAVLFKTQQRYQDITPIDGLHVLCRGRISLYEPRGEYQVIVDSLEVMGKGSLQEAFETTKKQLMNEGLFEQSRKKSLPFLPKTIALITSPQGAAVHDFLHIAALRFPSIPITIHPVTVQGDGAEQEIIRALTKVNDENIADVISLCRGGGSLEDLWTFNSEHLARAIATSHIPVVTGIGHETDFTIADFVADVRAPTPTAAAEKIIPDKKHLLETVETTEKRLALAMRSRLDTTETTIEFYRRILRNPEQLLDHALLRVDHLQSRIVAAFISRQNACTGRLQHVMAKINAHHPDREVDRYLEKTQQCRKRIIKALSHQIMTQKNNLTRCMQLLAACNPDNILARGYAIVSVEHGTHDKEIIVKKSSQVLPGAPVKVRLHKGRLRCQVIETEKE